jgi:hypothetical protein
MRRCQESPPRSMRAWRQASVMIAERSKIPSGLRRGARLGTAALGAQLVHRAHKVDRATGSHCAVLLDSCAVVRPGLV